MDGLGHTAMVRPEFSGSLACARAEAGNSAGRRSAKDVAAAVRNGREFRARIDRLPGMAFPFVAVVQRSLRCPRSRFRHHNLGDAAAIERGIGRAGAITVAPGML